MYRTSVKRAAAGLAALAISGAGLIALAPPASAAEVGATLAVDTPVPVILNVSQPDGQRPHRQVDGRRCRHQHDRPPGRPEHHRLLDRRRGRCWHQLRVRRRQQPECDHLPRRRLRRRSTKNNVLRLTFIGGRRGAAPTSS